MKRVALLSHRGGNIGHDFMAIGIEQALGDAFGDELEVSHFEQHNHFEVYPQGHWLRWINRMPHGRLRFVRRYLNTRKSRQRFWPQTASLDYDLAVACGGPNIVPGGSSSAELGLMLHHMNGAFHYRSVPLIDAGVGACFPLEQVPDQLQDPADRSFYKTAVDFCSLVTVRDTAAQAILRDLGFEPPLIPCAAIGTGRVFEQHAASADELAKYVMINFQGSGANTDWGQGVDPGWWMATMRAAIADLEKRHPVMLLAHSTYERKLAAELAPQVKCALPETAEEYARTISMAKVGIVSRIHAAIPLAGIGVPSVVTGTDTRLGTVEQMGLVTAYVKQASADWLVQHVEELVTEREHEHERLHVLREDTVAEYAKLFRSYAKGSAN